MDPELTLETIPKSQLSEKDCADIILPKEANLLPPKDYQPDPPEQIDDYHWKDRDGRIYQAVPEVNEIGIVHDPTIGKNAPKIEDFEESVHLDPPDPSIFEAIDYVIEHLGKDKYVCSPAAGLTPMTMIGGSQKAQQLQQALVTEKELLMYALHTQGGLYAYQ